MIKAKPTAINVICSMIAGSLIGLATSNIIAVAMPPIVRETFAMIIVGLLLFIIAVLNIRLIELALFSACFFITAIASEVIAQTASGLHFTIGLTSFFIAFIICDVIMKKLT
jgi:hypothetical protein